MKNGSLSGPLCTAIMVLSGWLFYACAAEQASLNEADIKARFESGKRYLEKKKYLRAQEEFNYVILSGAHTELADDAQFYLGEAYFLNKEYLLASAEYDRLVRQLPFSPYVEGARYRICESYLAESPGYYHDQTYTHKALDKLQEFLDDYPNSEYRSEASAVIGDLRNKLAFKLYQTAILYIKLEEYPAAILALEELVEKYYDTDYIDRAHVAVIRCHSLGQDLEAARDYYDRVEERLVTAELSAEALEWITAAEAAAARRKS